MLHFYKIKIWFYLFHSINTPFYSYDFLICTDGRIITPYVDITDGIYKTATSDLIAYSESSSCAELLIQALKHYIADSLNEEMLFSMESNEIYSVYFENNEIRTNDETIDLSEIYEDDSVKYTIKYIK